MCASICSAADCKSLSVVPGRKAPKLWLNRPWLPSMQPRDCCDNGFSGAKDILGTSRICQRAECALHAELQSCCATSSAPSLLPCSRILARSRPPPLIGPAPVMTKYSASRSHNRPVSRTPSGHWRQRVLKAELSLPSPHYAPPESINENDPNC